MASQAFQCAVINTAWNYSVASGSQIKGQGRLGAAQLTERRGAGKPQQHNTTTAATHTSSLAEWWWAGGGGG